MFMPVNTKIMLIFAKTLKEFLYCIDIVSNFKILWNHIFLGLEFLFKQLVIYLPPFLNTGFIKFLEKFI